MDRVNEKLNEYKVPLGILLVGGVLLVGGLFSSNLIQGKKSEPESENFPKESIVSESQLNDVKVDVAGAVNAPGVFSLSKEGRIEDAIKLAGGFDSKANKEFVSRSLNLSQKVSDGMKIYIPFEGESADAIKVSKSAVAGVSASTVGKVGVNSADQALLESLPGVGPATAKKIIDNRPYGSVEELLSKKAVSKGVYSKIMDLVDIN